LRHEPWCESGFWKAAITCVYNKNSGDADNQECIQVALDRVRRVLSPLILRRSKDTLDSKGEPILTLPPIEEKVVDVHLSVPEREFYNALKSKSQSIFEGIVNKGAFTKSYFQIFALLNRLRQCCDHVALTVKSLMDEDDWNSTEFGPSAKASLTPSKKNVKEDDFNQEFLEGLLQKFRSAHSVVNKENLPGKDYTITVATKISQVVSSRAEYFDDECAICLENPGIYDAAITPCAHVFCRDCLVNILVKAAAEINEVKQKNKEQSKPANTFFASCPDGECPCCKEQIQAKQVITLYRGQDGKTETKYLLETKFAVKSDDSSTDVARQTLENALKGEGSSKLAAILEELNKIWEQDPGSKVLIFSQFLGFLDLLQSALRKHKIPHGRLDGKLSLAERKYVVDQFKTDTADKRGSVLLMSMKAGGVGLNLVQASAVFIVDSWWNSAVEDQW
jgi:DNA repair protein RAD5